MAKKTTVIVICDRHRGEVKATGTVDVAIDGQHQKLDLCGEHLTEFRRQMRPWLRQSASRPRKASAPARKAAAKGAPRRRSASDAADIRAWAQQSGYDVPSRGRLPAALREAYNAR